ncbi:flavin reductase family protein [Acidiphilium sp. AL]|uniref:Flavin reductase family protein n=1 Tax=Acidiphilium iwatense TaxID=768198 RepID=A0ABS9E1N8_9PROT|nr:MULTISPECIES: flavin reductase family protein [Acidiphilium]MCF3948834.1 flavin reductase family protein [Acidiphilium iwatense]MCU4162198.1 flavin reductase family protein [Acidiphilium sp. AL]
MEFDYCSFRKALSHFATGVAVVTARGPAHEPIGMTMTSFNSVSLDPPLVLFSVDRRALSLPAMVAAQGYAINILSRCQETLSGQFAQARGEKWANVEVVAGYTEAPLLQGALAHFECEPHAHYDAGDHVIFVIRVIRFSANEREAPLLFFRGKYHSVGEGALS